jgi:hypothetical protein
VQFPEKRMQRPVKQEHVEHRDGAQEQNQPCINRQCGEADSKFISWPLYYAAQGKTKDAQNH